MNTSIEQSDVENKLQQDTIKIPSENVEELNEFKLAWLRKHDSYYSPKQYFTNKHNEDKNLLSVIKKTDLNEQNDNNYSTLNDVAKILSVAAPATYLGYDAYKNHQAWLNARNQRREGGGEPPGPPPPPALPQENIQRAEEVGYVNMPPIRNMMTGYMVQQELPGARPSLIYVPEGSVGATTTTSEKNIESKTIDDKGPPKIDATGDVDFPSPSVLDLQAEDPMQAANKTLLDIKAEKYYHNYTLVQEALKQGQNRTNAHEIYKKVASYLGLPEKYERDELFKKFEQSKLDYLNHKDIEHEKNIEEILSNNSQTLNQIADTVYNTSTNTLVDTSEEDKVKSGVSENVENIENAQIPVEEKKMEIENQVGVIKTKEMEDADLNMKDVEQALEEEPMSLAEDVNRENDMVEKELEETPKTIYYKKDDINDGLQPTPTDPSTAVGFLANSMSNYLQGYPNPTKMREWLASYGTVVAVSNLAPQEKIHINALINTYRNQIDQNAPINNIQSALKDITNNPKDSKSKIQALENLNKVAEEIINKETGMIVYVRKGVDLGSEEVYSFLSKFPSAELLKEGVESLSENGVSTILEFVLDRCFNDFLVSNNVYSGAANSTFNLLNTSLNWILRLNYLLNKKLFEAFMYDFNSLSEKLGLISGKISNQSVKNYQRTKQFFLEDIYAFLENEMDIIVNDFKRVTQFFRDSKKWIYYKGENLIENIGETSSSEILKNLGKSVHNEFYQEYSKTYDILYLGYRLFELIYRVGCELVFNTAKVSGDLASKAYNLNSKLVSNTFNIGSDVAEVSFDLAKKFSSQTIGLIGQLTSDAVKLGKLATNEIIKGTKFLGETVQPSIGPTIDIINKGVEVLNEYFKEYAIKNFNKLKEYVLEVLQPLVEFLKNYYNEFLKLPAYIKNKVLILVAIFNQLFSQMRSVVTDIIDRNVLQVLNSKINGCKELVRESIDYVKEIVDDLKKLNYEELLVDNQVDNFTKLLNHVFSWLNDNSEYVEKWIGVKASNESVQTFMCSKHESQESIENRDNEKEIIDYINKLYAQTRNGEALVALNENFKNYMSSFKKMLEEAPYDKFESKMYSIAPLNNSQIMPNSNLLEYLKETQYTSLGRLRFGPWLNYKVSYRPTSNPIINPKGVSRPWTARDVYYQHPETDAISSDKLTNLKYELSNKYDSTFNPDTKKSLKSTIFSPELELIRPWDTVQNFNQYSRLKDLYESSSKNSNGNQFNVEKSLATYDDSNIFNIFAEENRERNKKFARTLFENTDFFKKLVEFRNQPFAVHNVPSVDQIVKQVSTSNTPKWFNLREILNGKFPNLIDPKTVLDLFVFTLEKKYTKIQTGLILKKYITPHLEDIAANDRSINAKINSDVNFAIEKNFDETINKNIPSLDDIYKNFEKSAEWVKYPDWFDVRKLITGNFHHLPTGVSIEMALEKLLATLISMYGSDIGNAIYKKHLVYGKGKERNKTNAHEELHDEAKKINLDLIHKSHHDELHKPKFLNFKVNLPKSFAQTLVQKLKSFPEKKSLPLAYKDEEKCFGCGNTQNLLGHDKNHDDFMCEACVAAGKKTKNGASKRTTKFYPIENSSHNAHKEEVEKRKNNEILRKIKTNSCETLWDKFHESAKPHFKDFNFHKRMGAGYSIFHDKPSKDDLKRLTYLIGAHEHNPYSLNDNHKANINALIINHLLKHNQGATNDTQNKGGYIMPGKMLNFTDLHEHLLQEPHVLKRYMV
jgi:hypothetical protein